MTSRQHATKRQEAPEWTMKKSDVLELLQNLPVDLDINAFIYALWFRRKIERALAEADEVEGIPHEEFVRESDAWLV
jgi:hypothetical protein